MMQSVDQQNWRRGLIPSFLGNSYLWSALYSGGLFALAFVGLPLFVQDLLGERLYGPQMVSLSIYGSLWVWWATLRSGRDRRVGPS
jgi:hypothetical protein